MLAENARLLEIKKGNSLWRKWGPYLTDRQWGTVREDYSVNGDAWDYVSHDAARSKAYRWGEEGIGGICDDKQTICFALSFWNGKDLILKERYFGLTGKEGNHGEDVKEYFYYLENIPTHSYMKMLYKYPQTEFPYSQLLQENQKRGKLDPEFELIDTGIFNEDKYFDVFIEYSKADPEDILIKLTVCNRANENAMLNVVPQIWFRNTWSWGYDDYKPGISTGNKNYLLLSHQNIGNYSLFYEENPELLFCDSDTNIKKLYNVDSEGFFKDGINDFIVNGKKEAVNNTAGTKAGINYKITLPALGSKVIRLRLKANSDKPELINPFEDFDSIFNLRTKETDEFYEELESQIKNQDEKNVQRQALAGMLWCKQFYYYDVRHWLKGDPSQPSPPPERYKGRNNEWNHLNNSDIISMPDKWEYPWYASWDLAFHCIPFALIDPEFAKHQLRLLTREWYMNPNGQLPAYEWNFSDVNPPVHAWATWRVYKIDQKANNGHGDIPFLESVFHKLLLNFTWWVNRKDEDNRNIFQGGFLGLDNIGVFDRSAGLPEGGHLEEADATSWMAMFSLNLLRISLELSKHNPVYQDVATKFLEHFLFIAGAMTDIGGEGIDLWDEEDQFFYDVLHTSDDKYVKLKVRSMVGLIPLFAVEVLEPEIMSTSPKFSERLDWFLNYRPDLANLVSRWQDKGMKETRLFSLLRGHRLKKILNRMLDETEFLSEYGIRALSKYHEKNPYVLLTGGKVFSVNYEPAESQTGLFGGNSNWRGPVWFPVNFLIIESLQRFHHYYGDDFKVEYPVNSGKYLTLKEISNELTTRLSKIFLKDENGNRPVFGENKKFQTDPHFKDYILFHEYFNGDNGKGLGASHQTGWTGLIAKLLQPKV
ncbi:MAG: MGH1-like glycoside hydrolase domain-containing protein [Ignavibacteriaceae bacterium]